MMKKLFKTFIFLTLTLSVSAQLPKIENGGLVLDHSVLFQTGSAVLRSESDSALNQVKAFLLSKEYITLMRIEGHLAAGMDETKGQSLSEKRALAVCRWLIHNGIDCKRLIAVGFGSQKPIADNSTPPGKAQNTRIEFKMAALRDRPIGGMPVDGGGRVAGDICN